MGAMRLSGALRYEVADMNEDAHHCGDDPAADRRYRAHPVSPLATLTQLPALQHPTIGGGLAGSTGVQVQESAAETSELELILERM
jgi:hypothetical protein